MLRHFHAFKKDVELTESVKKSIFAAIIMAVAAALQFVFNVVVSRSLGAELSGMFFLSFNIILFLGIISRLGFDLSIVRIASPLWGKNKFGTISSLAKSTLISTLISSVIISVLLVTLSKTISMEVFNEPRLVNVLRISALALTPISIGYIFAAFLRSNKLTSKALAVQQLALYGPAILFTLLFSKNASGASLALVVSSLVIMFTGLIMYKRISTKLRIIRAKDYDYGLLFRLSLPLLVTVAALRIMNWLDTFMIGYFENPESVSLYNAAIQISLTVSFVLLAFNTINAPKFSELYGAKKFSLLLSLFKKTQLVIFTVSIPVAITVLVFSNTILSLFGDEFIESKVALAILVFGQIINASAGSVGYLLAMTGDQNKLATITILINVMNIALNIVLIPKYGINGAAMATSSSIAVSNIVLYYFASRKFRKWSSNLE